MQLKTGTVNGKPAVANYDPDTGKLKLPDGTDVTSTFQPKEPTEIGVDKRIAELVGIPPSKRTKDQQRELTELKSIRTLNVTTGFGLRNPEADQGAIDKLASLASNGRFDEAMKLVGSNVVQRNQLLQTLQQKGLTPYSLTSNTKQMGETARVLVPKMDHAIEMLNDPKYKDLVGPLAGRFNEFMTGEWGGGNPDFAELRSIISLINTGTMRAHVGARGSGQMLEYFSNLADAKKMDAETLKSSLKGTRDFIKGYRDNAFPPALFDNPPEDTAGAKVIVQYSKSKNQWRHSTDGGKTWKDGKS